VVTTARFPNAATLELVRPEVSSAVLTTVFTMVRLSSEAMPVMVFWVVLILWRSRVLYFWPGSMGMAASA